jgi:hypothetical protein
VPASKRVILTRHARLRIAERQLNPKWVEDAARDPDWTEPEPKDTSIERRFRRIDAFGGRFLRVACVETESTIRVISVLFDRNARRKP